LTAKAEAQPSLIAEDLLRLAQVVDRFLVLPGLVGSLALRAQVLHFLHLRFGELGILGERVVDLLHVLRAMERHGGAGGEQERDAQGKHPFHDFSLGFVGRADASLLQPRKQRSRCGLFLARFECLADAVCAAASN
jgi:hypothetical protein